MNIKIDLARSAGFCFGVRRAIGLAFETAKRGKTVHMLGDIVHNEEVVKDISNAGIKKIKTLKNGKNSILLIRAHGTPPEIPKKALSIGYQIVDATCPMVKEIHRKVSEMEKNGYRIIVIGDKKHDEVRGIVGQLKTKAIVIETKENIKNSRVNNIKKACIVVQSTQNLETVEEIVKLLKAGIKEVVFHNTICNPTRTRQNEIKEMARKNDCMVIIGSKKSANTKRLFEISKKLNKNSYWVTGAKGLRKVWFKGKKSAGITAGASTPDSTTGSVIGKIRDF
ncbi:MAG TPA: 4-hydroxy-3-methylbut-2-enyl diphosphate reductase [Candidatus Omnitrophota bacterium]|nr:4-hydroxy-3-methylbut-2-enyl diphosphate reductase [Candidatus Omnitrophota bacterium]